MRGFNLPQPSTFPRMWGTQECSGKKIWLLTLSAALCLTHTHTAAGTLLQNIPTLCPHSMSLPDNLALRTWERQWPGGAWKAPGLLYSQSHDSHRCQTFMWVPTLLEVETYQEGSELPFLTTNFSFKECIRILAGQPSYNICQTL